MAVGFGQNSRPRHSLSWHLARQLPCLAGLDWLCLTKKCPRRTTVLGCGDARPARARQRRDNSAGERPSGLQRSVRGRGDTLGVCAERFIENNMARSTNHARRASTSHWSAVCGGEWECPTAGHPGSSASVWSLQSNFGSLPGADWIRQTFFWFAFVVCLIACPSFMSLSQLARRNDLLGYEIMLPVQRRTYLKQVGMAVAISCLRTWGGMSVAFMLWWITAAPEPLRFGLGGERLGVLRLGSSWAIWHRALLNLVSKRRFFANNVAFGSRSDLGRVSPPYINGGLHAE